MNNFQLRLITGLLLVAIIGGIVKLDNNTISLTFLGIIFFISNIEVIKILTKTTFKLGQKAIIYILYILFPFIFIFEFFYFFGWKVIGMLFLISALTDSFAYFTGKLIGNRKFSDISPKKTIEGVIGGVFFASAIITTISVVYSNPIYGIDLETSILNFSVLFVISVVLATTSVYSDLFESYLKRKANIKDSGNILPGHGGVLDRMDSILGTFLVFGLFLHIYMIIAPW